MKKPNFFIIGAPKCGTTSLAAWLEEHPKVYMSPIKEPFYFSSDIGNQLIKKWEVYTGLFSEARPEHVAVGEASTAYLFSRVAVLSIEEQLPGSRYIVMLRNPVEMAYALHEQQIRVYNETISDFSQAWFLSSERRAGRQVPSSCVDPVLLDYQSWCRLGEQLERLYDGVPLERVLVLVLDDLREDPRREYQRVLEFLGVPGDGREYFPVYNPSHEWRSPYIGKLIRRLGLSVGWAKHVARILPKRSTGVIRFLQRMNTQQRQRPDMPIELRVELERFFDDDLCRLEQLLGRKLPAWHQNGGKER